MDDRADDWFDYIMDKLGEDNCEWELIRAEFLYFFDKSNVRKKDVLEELLNIKQGDRSILEYSIQIKWIRTHGVEETVRRFTRAWIH